VRRVIFRRSAELYLQRTAMRDGRRIEVRGTVQGVGFRPWVYRLAHKHDVAGRVSNDARGVVIDVYASDEQIDRFIDELDRSSPPASRIDVITCHPVPFEPVDGFTIVPSARGEERRISVPPELATCDECLAEVDDPANRRYRYAFTNCTNCGPRYSIVRDIPYDRAATTMQRFTMCRDCRREYDDPLDRRFHAEPNACPACGPRLSAVAPDGTPMNVDDPIALAVRAIKAGLIVAVKGIGGFHLACDATSETAVARLRRRKHRDAKPFAVMVADLASAEKIALLDDEERALLTLVERPIVLAHGASQNDLAGVFLPYSPLHHILLRDAGRPLVMTSGNLAGEPMVRDNATALRALGGVADLFLMHDRDIENRVDDSVARVIAGKPVLFRRARGFVPRGFNVARPFVQPVLACGAHLKNTFCIAAGDTAFLGPHIGDLEGLETYRDYCESIDRAKKLLGITPEVVAHDLHPGYQSTRYALEQRGVTTIAVQHHHAHVAGVMAEHRLDGPVIGIAWDGTGHGTDGTSWGGELLIATRSKFERVATFRPLPLAGGDRAVREVWRIALAAVDEIGEGDFTAWPAEAAVVRQLIAAKLNAPLSHGAGRWFDVFGALFLGRTESRYEGEIAMEWNNIADRDERGWYALAIDRSLTPWQIDMRVVLACAVSEFRNGVSPAKISARFHNTLARAAAAIASQYDLPVVLAGGCFQNSLLTERIIELLEPKHRVFFNQQIPPGDGGIAFGQAIVADAIVRGGPGGA
jgi:hydrogenase maturation protein HypF